MKHTLSALQLAWFVAAIQFGSLSFALADQPAPANTSAGTPAAGVPATPSYCDALYPPSALQAGIAGTTTLSVHIREDGTLENIALLKTSGNDDLDHAAIACAGQTKRQQKSGGQAVAVNWQASVVWNLTRHSYVFVPISTACSFRAYPASAVMHNEQGTVAYSYSIDEHGSVSNLRVTKSSGFPDLDDAAFSCLTDWRFPPAMQDGKPVSIDRQGRQTFSMH